MKVTPFVYCEGFLPQDGKPPAIQGVLNIITPQFIPTTFSFGILFGIIGIELEKTHTLTYQFVDPSKKVVLSMDNIQATVPRNMSLPDEIQGLIMHIDLRNVLMETEGEYKSTITVDGEFVGEFPIVVKALRNNG